MLQLAAVPSKNCGDDARRGGLEKRDGAVIFVVAILVAMNIP